MKDKSYKVNIIKKKKANDKKQIKIYDILYEEAMSEFRDKTEDFLYRLNDSIFRDVIITSGDHECSLKKYLEHYMSSTSKSTTTYIQVGDRTLHINYLRDKYVERRIETLSANLLACLKVE